MSRKTLFFIETSLLGSYADFTYLLFPLMELSL